MEGHKDQGINVREKAKQLVALLRDDERLRNERARALKAKERFAQSLSGFGSDGVDSTEPSNNSDVGLTFFFLFIINFLLYLFIFFKLFLVSRVGSLPSGSTFIKT